MAKKVTGFINLTILGGAANPSPPVGPALGQHGVNIMEFCKAFNAKTEDSKGIPIPVVISVYEDRSFDFITKTPPASYFIKKAAKLKKGSGTPSREVIGQIRKSQVKEIAEAKMVDLNANDIDAAMHLVQESDHIIGATPYISLSGLLQKDSKMKALQIRAINPDTEGQVTDIEKYIDDGGWSLLKAGEQRIILGKSVADNFK